MSCVFCRGQDSQVNAHAGHTPFVCPHCAATPMQDLPKDWIISNPDYAAILKERDKAREYANELTAAYLEASGKLQNEIQDLKNRDSYREDFIETLRSDRDALREELKLAIEQRNHEQRCVEQKQRLLVQGAKHTKWLAERAERFRKERESALASSNRNEHALNQIQEIAEECVSNPGCELNTVDLVKKMADSLKEVETLKSIIRDQTAALEGILPPL